jgi:hypothetical protein
MLRSLAKFSESEASNHAPSLADFITTMVGFKVFGYTHVNIATLSVHPLAFCLKYRSKFLLRHLNYAIFRNVNLPSGDKMVQ